MLNLRKCVASILAAGAAMAACAETPAVGSLAPDFSLQDQQLQVRKLTDFRGKWLVLYFYPKDDTPGCTTEACSFRDGQALISALGAQVVGVSIDDTSSHSAFAEKHKLPFPLLADTDGRVAARYGALSDWKVVKFAKRETFLIDPKGVVRKAYLNVDADTHAAQVLADLRTLVGK
ncbi:peroxiredoxin [Uliginosibacterium sp. H3]|uniref:thioredoxin-dependent peroxiredoxin n=1 Tax=Uliginosibacterium silvisoli TaxID=3114758 RepID=A0ABU6K7H4_9RHOO|nr:peroxiredoxin [Uliginosibacterium sp. H3]